MGLQRETAGRSTIAVYGQGSAITMMLALYAKLWEAQIVFASTFERIFFHTLPSPLSIVGTVIIIGSALYVVVSIISSMQANHTEQRRVVM